MTDFVFSTSTMEQESYEQAARLGMPVNRDTMHNGNVDAFRHAYANARFTHMYGDYITRKAGFEHEQSNLSDAFKTLRYPDQYEQADIEQTKREIVMDLYNNDVGRRYGVENPNATQNELADIVYKKGIQGNELIQSDKDPRIERYQEYYLKKLDDGWIRSENEQQSPDFKVASADLNTAQIFQPQELAANASTMDIINHAYAAAISDNPDQSFKLAMQDIGNTQFAANVKVEAKELTQAYVAQQAALRVEVESPVIRGSVMRL